MNWNIDLQTQHAAHNFPILIQAAQPAPQFPGRPFNPANWLHRIRPQDYFAVNVQTSDPQTIINTFQNGEYLQGLALVVSWGSMWRTAKSIYGGNALQDIYESLHESAGSITHTESIENAWAILIERLSWSAVITSKVLHFLCRSLGFQDDPPVAIDNAVILQKVWPAFKNNIPFGQRPRSWRGDGIDAYFRYMTAVIEWASMSNWTTTDMETTLFNEFKTE